MNKKSLTLMNRVLCVVIAGLIFGSLLIAQELKSSPQGNQFLKLNGTFEIPVESNLRTSPAISMIVSDLNGDGIDDLIAGRENGVSVQMGDINAFAPQTQEAWEAIRDLRFISPFRTDGRLIELPVRPDFLLSGDFDRDSRMDIIAASSGGSSIYLITGDGRGGFVNIREIFVGGTINTMISGDVNRLDGLPDVIVGAGNEVFIYQGFGDILSRAPERVSLPNKVETMAVGQLDTNSFTDIAVGNGNQISIISGSDGRNEVNNLTQNFYTRSLIVGDFVPDRGFRPEIAALDDGGTIHVILRGNPDTRTISPKEHLADQVRKLLAQNITPPERIMKKLTKEDLREPAPYVESDNQTWSEYDQFFGAVPDGISSSNAVLTSGRLSNFGEDIIVLDSANNQVIVMPLVEFSDTGERVSYAGKRQPVKFSLEDAPIAAVAGRFNFDGDKDLLVLQNGRAEPAALLTAPNASFTVNSSGDQVDANPGNGVCATSGAVCTLRAAIMEANRLTGNDSITINPGINITLSTGKPDNDFVGENSASYGDLDIFCSISASEDFCVTPNSTDNNDLSITGAAGGNTISAGTFSPSTGTGVTTDRVFDIGFDGVFGGGFGGGTGIDVVMSNLTIQNGNVREDINIPLNARNFARGAAVRIDGFGGATRGSLTLGTVTINNNQADNDTGGVFNQFASIDFSSVTATTNIGKAGSGGALAFLASFPATLNISNSTFSSNEARNGTVNGVQATDVDGGAIAANFSTNTGTITNTNLTNNIAFDDGGGLKVFSGAVTVTGGTISGNTSRDDGGGVWGDNDTVSAGRFMTLSGVTIRGNTANSDSTGGGDGGGVYRDRGTLNVTNCTIGGLVAGQANNANNGGGIAHAFRAGVTPSNQTTVNIDNGSITANNATVDGGGVFINATNQNVGTPSVLNVGAATTVTVTENNANAHGGGIAVSGGVANTLTRATFSGNDADADTNSSGDGGGLYHNNSGQTTTIASTVSFTTNGNGTATTENGGAIHHSNGTLTLNSPPISGNDVDVHGGGLFVSGGIVNVNGVTFSANTFPANAAEVRLSGGTTNFSGTVTIPGELSIAGGTLSAGSSTVNLGEDFHFSSGTFTAGTSLFNFNGSAAQQIYGGATPTLNNLTDSNTAAQLSVNNNANVSGNLTVDTNAVLNPAPTVVIGGSGTLTGNGTARVTRTAATADFLSQYTISNKTLTNLLVDYVGSSAQTVSALTYGGLRLNNSAGASLAGNTTVGGTFTLQSGNLAIGTNTLTLNNGTSAGTGTFSSAATGTVNYNQGSGGQNVLAGDYGNLTFSNFSKVLPSATVKIAGTFTPNGVANTITGNTIEFNGAGAQTIPSFTYNNLTTSTGGVKTTGTTVNVNGNATVGASTTLTVPMGSTLTVGGTLTNNNIINGTGTIANNFSNSGTLNPGTSPGTLNITGTFANSGTMNIEIGGTGGAGVNPNGHDQLLVSGAATIGGTLNVALTNGFTPAPGNSFLILDAASSTGTFAATNLPDILPNQWSVVYDNTAGTVTLNVVAPTAANVTVGGRVLNRAGRGLVKAVVTMTDANGDSRSVRSNSFGYYRFDGVAAGQNYLIAVQSKEHRFTPRAITVSDNVFDVNFIALN